MQDMSGVTTEPASSPPRTLVSDVIAEKSVTDQAKNKTKDSPKRQDGQLIQQEEHIIISNKTRHISPIGSIDRHSSERQSNTKFPCKMCDTTFSTNAGLHRHMRSHKPNIDVDSDSDDYEGNLTSISPLNQQKKRKIEYNNNNDKGTNGCEESSEEEDEGPPPKRKPKTINNNIVDESSGTQNLACPVCSRKHFDGLPSLEAHIEETHPDYQVKCSLCKLSFKNLRILSLHKLMVHHPDRKTLTSKKISNSISGFKDCTFIDFSSEKFPQIAKEMCEKFVHKSITEQKFRCKLCVRDFPCESALNIHIKNCFPSVSGETVYANKTRRESSGTEEDARRDDFFANLNLQNKSPNYIPSILPSMGESAKLPITSDYFHVAKDAIYPLADNTKDLADIQSILSVASTRGLFEQLNHKSREVLSQDHSTPKPGDENEEGQDAFAAEFRKMKLRGEFPCRLCTAIFPNLRALKGHNRVHLSSNGPGPYRCNMCPHSSLDKAALVRHMRTHNGDRPYECSVCNYAFTTKANCERHLRNRHSKVTREEVKRSIIYHPSEDPNNDEVNSKLNISKEDIKRSAVIYTPPDTDRRDERHERNTPHFIREPSSFGDHKLPLPLQRDLPLVIPQPRAIHPINTLDSIRPNLPTPEELIKVRLQGKAFGQLTQIPEFIESDRERENDSDDDVKPTEEVYPKVGNYTEGPMDLSTGEFQDDALDLSNKKSVPDNAPETPNSDNESENYASKSSEFNNNQATAASVFEKTQQFLLAQQQLIKNLQMQKLDPASFYASQLSNLYRAGTTFPGLGLPPGFPLNPYVLTPNLFLGPPSNAKELAEMKEKIQKDIIMGLQMSGGGLVGMDHNNIMNNMALASERLQAFHQQQQAMNNNTSHESKCSTPIPNMKSEDDAKPLLQINIETPTSTAYSNPIPSPKAQKKENSTNSSPNSVKMVIKNGVLMPKQKQRRYRTERPFSCEHCSARFTLRSNMERHIKQQHPQYWSQRQRSNIGIPRKSPISMVPQNVTVPSLNYEGQLNFMKNSNDAGNLLSDDEKDSSLMLNKTGMISDQVKYAILAQKLKSHCQFTQDKHLNKNVNPGENEEEDEDDALIIDEEDDADDVREDSQEPDKDDPNSMAKKVAREILNEVASKKQNDIAKDFDWKIAGNLISKNSPNPMIPAFVSEIGQNENEAAARAGNAKDKQEEGDLVSVSRLLDNAVTHIPFGKYFKNDFIQSQTQNNDSGVTQHGEGSEEDEEGLVASSSSTSEENNSGSDGNRSESETTAQVPQKKKSAYSLAPNRVSCPYCHRKFPWSSSLRRHVLTHTGQKPFKCPHCPLLFTTKSNCDRHLLRKHGSQAAASQQNVSPVLEVSPVIPIPGLVNHGLMRNVPERPFKCANCPSSTFSTYGNLKKHMSSKHNINIPDSNPNSPKLEDGNFRSAQHDSHSSDDDKSYKSNQTEVKDFSKSSVDGSDQRSDWDSQISSKYSPTFNPDVPSNIQNTDLPFKCHLCDHSYAERQEALDHIKDLHTSEYELLMSKGALETSVGFTEEQDSLTPSHRSECGDEQAGDESGENQRGKFPQYTNRKVVCAFCMRRFWSAEDLRRHMRTHSGERPFECDVCRRRFTLKHSMLRHLKKHTQTSNSEDMDVSTASGDEDNTPHNYSTSSGSTASPSNSYQYTPNSSTPISSKNPLLTLSGYQLAINKNLSPDIPNNVNNNNSPPAQNYEGKVKVKNVNIEDYKRIRYSSDDNEAQEAEIEAGNDLIGNLLGISDKGMINKLLSSPDEAAKLLGVNK